MKLNNMNKHIKFTLNKSTKTIIFTLIGILIATLINININDRILSILYGVSGIMFSVGMRLIITFNLTRIKNHAIKDTLKDNLSYIRKIYIVFFSLSTFFYLISNLSIPKLSILNYTVNINVSILTCYAISLVILYFIISLISLQRLNNDIDKKLEMEEKQHKNNKVKKNF